MMLWVFLAFLSLVTSGAAKSTIGIVVDDASPDGFLDAVDSIVRGKSSSERRQSADIDARVITISANSSFLNFLCSLTARGPLHGLVWLSQRFGPFGSWMGSELGVPVASASEALRSSGGVFQLGPTLRQEAAVLGALLRRFHWDRSLLLLHPSERHGAGLVGAWLSSSAVSTGLVELVEGGVGESLKDIAAGDDRLLLLLTARCGLVREVMEGLAEAGLRGPDAVLVLSAASQRCVDSAALPGVLALAHKPFASPDGPMLEEGAVYSAEIERLVSGIELFAEAHNVAKSANAFWNPPEVKVGPKCIDWIQSKRTISDLEYFRQAKLANGNSTLAFSVQRHLTQPAFIVLNSIANQSWAQPWQDILLRFLNGTMTASGVRSSLRGRHLRVQTHVDSDFGGWKTFWTAGRPPPNESAIPDSQLSGFNMDLLRRLARDIGFTYSLSYPPDRNWGAKDGSTGRWNGLLGQIEDGASDLAAATLTMTTSRITDFDFTVPVLETGFTFVLRKRQAARDVFKFVRVYEAKVWAAVLGTAVCAALLVSCLNKLSPLDHHGGHTLNYHDMQRNRRDRATRRRFRKFYEAEVGELSLANSLWLVWSLVLQEGHFFPRAASGRVVVLGCFVLATVFISTYTANMAAVLTTELLAEEISSLEDLAYQTDVVYGTDPDSGTWQFFDQSDVSLYRYMAGQMRKRPASFAKIDEGVERVRAGGYAFIWDKAVLDFEAMRRPCDVRTVGEPFNRITYGYALPRGSPATKELNVHILQLRESGFAQTLLDRWFSGRSECRDEEALSDEALRRMSAFNMAGVFGAIYAGMGLGLLILCAERLAKRRGREARASPKETLLARAAQLLSPHSAVAPKLSRSQHYQPQANQIMPVNN